MQVFISSLTFDQLKIRWVSGHPFQRLKNHRKKIRPNFKKLAAKRVSSQAQKKLRSKSLLTKCQLLFCLDWWIKRVIFCSTSLPLASIRWVQPTFQTTVHFPLRSASATSIPNFFLWKFLGNAGNRTWGSWKGKQVCTSILTIVLCCPPPKKSKLYYPCATGLLKCCCVT